jgi:hypothetical protein
MQIERLDNPRTREAEVLAFFGEYDAAEAVYTSMGRLDLAVQLFTRLGHWQKVETLVKVLPTASNPLWNSAE